MTPPVTCRLILTRHAKSSWDDPTMADIDRPLNARGQKGAMALGAWLASRGYLPDQVLCSTAVRTQETWTGIAKTLTSAAEVKMLPTLYQAGPDRMMNLLKAATGKCVLMLAHNPGIAAFASMLPVSRPLDPGFEHYPTGATLVLDFDIGSWADLQPGTGQVLDFITPRDLE